MVRYNTETLQKMYDDLAQRDASLQLIISRYGYPPVWIRPNNFETLVLIILEQQVSLASANAAWKKLKDKIDILPTELLKLSDEEMRGCYVSRQKVIYTRGLARAIVSGQINLEDLNEKSDDEVRSTLKSLKGIGDWTVDIYLIHALRRTDVFPTGDLALVNSIKTETKLHGLTKQELLVMSERWKPLRSLATMLFWHSYLMGRKRRNIE